MIKDYKTYVNEMKSHHNDIPAENQGGNCYQVGYRYFNENCHSNANLRLVHGLVTGQGKIHGIVYNHCWCEDLKSNTVIDMTMPDAFQMLPKVVYYSLGNIKEENVFKYTFDEVIEKSNEFGTYGPWEEKLLDNEY